MPTSPSQQNRLPRLAGSHCGLAKPDRGEIAARRIQRLAVLLDPAQQFAHRAREAVVEPASLEGGPRDAGFGVQFDRLLAEVRPPAGNRAARADDDGGILRPIARVAVEYQRGLPAGERYERLREQWR